MDITFWIILLNDPKETMNIKLNKIKEKKIKKIIKTTYK